LNWIKNNSTFAALFYQFKNKNMLKIKFLLSFIVLFSLCFVACKSDKKETPSTLNPGPTVPVQAEPMLSLEGAIPYKVTEGTIAWQGSHMPEKKHLGNIKVLGGEIMVKEGRILEGNVKIDMKSLTVTDRKAGEGKEKLEGHLKSADFFDVEKFPTAEFTIEETLPTSVPGIDRFIVGKLNLKGISKGVNIPVKFILDKNSLNVTSMTFQISRTEWGINFNSGLIGTAKDKIIDDVVLLSLILTAKP
jgi:polyisoprenoid-binding protein YceI